MRSFHLEIKKMYQYTTPTITVTLSGVNFTNVDYIRIAFQGTDELLLKQIAVADIDTTEGTAAIELTQEETVTLGEGILTIQARIHYTDGTVQATNKVVKKMYDVLDEVVI